MSFRFDKSFLRQQTNKGNLMASVRKLWYPLTSTFGKLGWQLGWCKWRDKKSEIWNDCKVIILFKEQKNWANEVSKIIIQGTAEIPPTYTEGKISISSPVYFLCLSPYKNENGL